MEKEAPVAEVLGQHYYDGLQGFHGCPSVIAGDTEGVVIRYTMVAIEGRC
jgi:hypothetical protein